jgi:K+-sensing histidine kinase KdpD
MEPAPTTPRHEAIDRDDLLVHEWRVMQLTRLGIPWSLAPARHEAAAAITICASLAHRNAPCSRNRAGWQDVEDLLAAGIDVISATRVAPKP